MRSGPALRWLMVLLCMATAAAHADTPQAIEDRAQAARAAFEEGRAHYKAGEYDRAKDLFEQAYRLKPLPLLLYNIAQAARLGGHFDIAIDNYRRYLLAVPDAPERAAVERYLEDLSAYQRDQEAKQKANAGTPVTNAGVVPPPQGNALVEAPPPRKKSRAGLIAGVTVGAVVVVGGAITLGVLLSAKRGAPPSDLGNVRPY